MPDQPPIADYGLIGDCHSAALVSREGSIDWCCVPRLDRGSSFGRLLDWERGGFCSIEPADGDCTTFREYVDGALVLDTSFRGGGGEAHVIDCFTMRPGGAQEPHGQILRVIEGTQGVLRFRIRVAPRFDYGQVKPWMRQHGVRTFSAIGGDDALLISCDAELQLAGDHELAADVDVGPGERVRLSILARRPEELDGLRTGPFAPEELDERLEETFRWWKAWTDRARFDGPEAPAVVRSAMVLKALTNAPTGAIAAAATTSLPEAPGGVRNWDYRYCWLRDAAFSVRSLADLGYEAEADGLRRFVLRSAAGSADELQIMYGIGGERRLTEVELDGLAGYRGARPVRVGNGAAGQIQLDAYGEVLAQAWRWHQRGNTPDDDEWRFLSSLVDAAAEHWEDPDRGIWEWRGRPRHFVHSKVMCWAAMEYGLRIAEECLRRAPVERWERARDACRRAIESDGYDEERGIFVQAFGARQLDAALLLLPHVDFVAYDDERMVRTTDAVREDLEEGGLLRRYAAKDGLPGREGAFLPASFWLAEAYARQHRLDDAREVFERTVATANGLGLFAEEYDAAEEMMLGNFPQGLTHLSHISAAVAIARARAALGRTG